MNSYEFDQPLDLRLKALNLSLSTYAHQHHPAVPTVCHNPASTATCLIGSNQHNSSTSSICSGSSSSSSSSSSSCSRSSSSVSSNGIGINQDSRTISNQSINNSSKTPPVSFMSHSRLQPIAAHTFQDHNHNHQQPQPPLPQANHPSHVRSSLGINIHCQPLNHHQPHPLSHRLHPAPSQLQQPSNSNQAHNLHQQHLHQQQATTSQPISRLISPPASHQQVHQSPMSLAQRAQLNQPQQLSPQQVSPIQNQYPIYHPMPIKSLSISGHHPFTSDLSLHAQQTSNTHNKSQIQDAKSGDSIPHHQLIKLSAGLTSNNQPMGSLYNTPDLNSSSSAASPNSNSHPTAANKITTSQQGATPNSSSSTTIATSNSSASPIIRQHSLVSRYNCKPCGIVFSQPETLRAHQEGYCTKRDRSVQATQLRSQSAVSPPIANQHQQSNIGNEDGAK